MNPNFLEIVCTVLFAGAVLHTFCAGFFQKLAHKYPEGSLRENLFHLLGEVEVVFGIWAAFFLTVLGIHEGFAVYDETHKLIGGAVHFLESQNFTEPAFVFVIMAMAATRPVILFAERMIKLVARLIPLEERASFYISALIIGPILGSFITEPAAMTVTALILHGYFYTQQMSEKFKYATLGLLFVNISIGGTLTHFAAPPVLMVASKYGWDTPFMMTHFGWKAAIAVVVGTLATAFYFRQELNGRLLDLERHENHLLPTWWMTLVHLIFLAAVVATAHHPVFFFGVFLFFLGFTTVTKEYQDHLKLKEALLVGFFLGGLVVLGSEQKWWLQPLLTQLDTLTLFFGATALTAITDNAALTYLGSLVELSEEAKYFLVAGAVTGGGLTVIANAPNPAGYGILKGCFKEGTINPLGLLVAALIPTGLAVLCFLLLPSF